MHRGDATARLTVYGAKVSLHSGHYGNYSPNPAQRLATLLASMKDDSGRVFCNPRCREKFLAAPDRFLAA